MTEQKRTFFVSYACKQPSEDGPIGFGAMPMDLAGPLNRDAVVAMREAIARTYTFPLDNIVILALNELEYEDGED